MDRVNNLFDSPAILFVTSDGFEFGEWLHTHFSLNINESIR